MGKKILIIGGVAAGPKTACRLKRLMPDAEVTIIDMDSIISYGGCGIPYFVSGEVSDEKEFGQDYCRLKDPAKSDRADTNSKETKGHPSLKRRVPFLLENES